MSKNKQTLARYIGILGTVAWVAVFIWRPSFPTPDKLLLLFLFVFMIFHQAIEMLKRLLPFVALMMIYESFRSVADRLNNHVNYSLAPHMDHLVFGQLPTVTLQNWLWKGRTSWYDIVLYIPYMLFFVVPLGLALLVWKTRDASYWRVVNTYLVVFFSAFLTFLLFPASPPWLASQNNYIEPITRVSSSVWASLGIHNFPSLYNHLSANPVAAVPSLHSAVATLFSIIIFKLYGRRWGLLSLIYPLLIYVGVVYEGEHYVFDVVCGIVYATAGYLLTPYLMDFGSKLIGRKRSGSKLKKASHAI